MLLPSLCLLSDYSMQIWKNGVVTFGVDSLQAKLSTPTRNFSAASATYLVAPLWFQNISSELVNSDVSWEEQRKGEGNETGYVLQFASDAVANASQEYFFAATEFTPTWAIIINWNVSLAPPIDDIERLCADFIASNCDNEESESRSTAESEGSSASGSGDSCYRWTPHDIGYLELLCSPRDRRLYNEFGILVSPSCLYQDSIMYIWYRDDCNNSSSLFCRFSFSWCWPLMVSILMLYLSTSVMTYSTMARRSLLSSIITPLLVIALATTTIATLVSVMKF